MIVKTIPSVWLKNEGNRLDCGPFVAGSVEAKYILKSLSDKAQHLQQVVVEDGILNGPKFKRHYVSSLEFGLPFLGSSDMVNARFDRLPIFSKAEACKDKLKSLILDQGTTLISCSGTIGKMAYTTTEMAGFLSSQHVMKVIPDESIVPSGYLFAFLSTSFAGALIKAGTYGAIITHIEPHHLTDLPVPRFENTFESKVHSLVEHAARNRAEVNIKLVGIQFTQPNTIYCG